MTCAQCGAPIEPSVIPEPQESGRFTEVWECANGHKGYVSGREEEPPTQWDKYGAIYE